MAKKKANQDVNKSAAVREILAQNPRTKVKDIVAQLAETGITVSPNHVYLIKSKAKARKRKQKRAKVMENTQRLGVVSPIELIRDVKKVAERAGGIRHLKELVDLLAE